MPRHADVDGRNEGILSGAERARLDRIRAPDRKEALRRSLIAIRERLSDWLDIPAEHLRIAHDEQGAPVLPDHPDVSISVSRTLHRTAIALSDKGAVGMDIEQVRPMDWQPMLSTISADEEARMLRKLTGNGSDLRPFFRAWTIKEAVMKAEGLGFRYGPKRVTVTEGLAAGESTRGALESGGHAYSLQLGRIEDHVFAVARRPA